MFRSDQKASSLRCCRRAPEIDREVSVFINPSQVFSFDRDGAACEEAGLGWILLSPRSFDDVFVFVPADDLFI